MDIVTAGSLLVTTNGLNAKDTKIYIIYAKKKKKSKQINHKFTTC